MKRISGVSCALLTMMFVLAFPLTAYADVAGVGYIVAFAVLPYVLIAAVIAIAAAILIHILRKRKK